jgi:glycosyltransferase involved in cell wall biosynthesis
VTATLGPVVICFAVVDEADIIEHFIEYHLALGVDGFVATDVGSTDGTSEILDRYVRRDCLHLLREADPAASRADYDGYVMVAAARDVFQADWCLCCDADEFWVFEEDDARRYFASAGAPVIIFPRYNMAPSRDPRSGRLLHFSEFGVRVRQPLEFNYDCRGLDERERVGALLSRYPPEILRRVAPKVAVRANAIRSLSHGFHDAVPNDPEAGRQHAEAGYLAHFPIRSPDQWWHKAELVTRYLINNPPEVDPQTGHAGSAFHWLRLSALFRHGLVAADFARQVLSEPVIEAGLRSGLLQRDDRLVRRLAGLRLERRP